MNDMNEFGDLLTNASSLLDGIERRLDGAKTHIQALNAAVDPEARMRHSELYEKVMKSIASDLEYLKKAFSSSGPLSSRVNVVALKATILLELIIRSIGLDPDEPGLSQKVEIKKAATVGRTTSSDVKKALDGFKLAKSTVAAGADLALTLVILFEVGSILVRRLRTKS